MDNESAAAFEAWHNEEFGWYNPDDIQWQKRLRTWNAARRSACTEVTKHFESYTNKESGLILANQVREVLK